MGSKRFIILFALYIGNIFATTGCDRSNPRKMSMPETFDTVVFQTMTSQINLHPKVDVLFVIDNSRSMVDHQQKLSSSIDSFVKSFTENEALDYHIGVVSVFDSKRFGSVVTKFTPNGELRPIPNAIAIEGLPTNYYTREHNNNEFLKEMLKIGVLEMKDGGPEKEESFSPVKAALSEPQISSEANKGFYRADAHLVIIFITDASDASPNLTADQLYSFLLDLKQQDYSKIHTFGVLADKQEAACVKVDPSLEEGRGNSGKPDNIIDFISQSRGRKLSICEKNYGPMLAAMGKEIEVKTSKQVIYLDSIPELKTLCICKVGDDCKTIAADGTNKCIKEGWKYDPANISIVFHDVAAILKNVKPVETGEGQVDSPTDIQLEVSFTPIKIQNVINGRTRRK
jgi:hypothetical protein